MTEYGRIHTDGSRSGGQPIPSEDRPKCERFGDDCGEHSPSWQELAAYWKAEAERLRQPTQGDALQADIDAMESILWVDTIIDDQEAIAKAFARHRQRGYDAGIEAAAKALEADARICDCAALEDRDCACGAWDDYKSITSTRAVEIVRELKGTQ